MAKRIRVVIGSFIWDKLKEIVSTKVHMDSDLAQITKKVLTQIDTVKG